MRSTTVDPTHDRLNRPEGLAERLRLMRGRAGLSGKALAEATGWQPSKVSRLENGRQRPSIADIEAWSRACGADQTATEALLALLSDVESFHRDWKRRMRLGQEQVQTDYNQLVVKSVLIRHFETAYIPGLLQTPEYARRALGEMVDLHALAVTDVDEAVAARLRRQQLLYDENKTFEFLLAEPVLHWLLCPAEAMAAQLDRLQTVIGLANVRFGVIPFGVPLRSTPQNAFQMYDDIAIVETFIGETIHRGPDAAAYAQAMDRLWAEAVTGDGARRLIVQAAHLIRG